MYLNGEEYHFLNNYQATQLVNIASQFQGNSIEFKIEVNTDEEYSFTGVRLAKTYRRCKSIYSRTPKSSDSINSLG